MVYTTEHRYLTFGGALPGGEIWQSGVRMAFPTGAVYADGAQNTSFSQLWEAVQTWFSGTSAAISNRATLEWVKQAIIQTTGGYKFGPALHEFVPPVAGGSASTSVHPNQVSLVVSMRTGTSFGQAQRGRFYQPLPAIPVSTNGRVSTIEADSVALAAKAFLDELNTCFTGLAPEKVVVMSAQGLGTTRLVTQVAIGDVLDTQRSRRNSLDELYQTENLA